MLDVLPLLLLIIAVILLVILSAIDLKHWILPDELNLALAVCGVLFHLLTAYSYVSLTDMLLGAACGAGLLYAIRFIANRHYGQDTLGLGDVKLLGAAGLWLGLEGTLEAITVGAFAGLVHGLCYAAWLSLRTKAPFSIQRLSIPAGPGFAVGIVAAGYFLYGDLALSLAKGFWS
jgi:prepilin signal peptidase PulO-like enzyme (type II secretory pathway)